MKLPSCTWRPGFVPGRAAIVLGIAMAVGGLAVNAARVSAQTPDLYDLDTLRTFKLTFANPFWYLELAANYPTRTHIKADLEVDGKTLKDVGVCFRGWSTYRLAKLKKPFEIKTDAFVKGQHLYGYRTLNLNNGGHDPTFVREVLTYHIFRKYCPAPQANYIKLVVNEVNLGVYVNVQQVNEDFGRSWFKIKDGNRYRAELKENAPPNASALVWLGANPSAYEQGYSLKTENSPNPWVDLIQVCDILNNRSVQDMERQLPGVLSVDSAIWMLAANNVVVNPDTYYFIPHNYYLYNDLFHGRLRLVSWDLDLAFSCTWPDLWKMDPFLQFNDPNRPLLSRMLQAPRFKETYLAHFRTVLENDFRWDVIGPLVSKWQALIDQEVKADPIKIFSYEAFKKNVTETVEERSGLKPFVETRRAYLLGLDPFKRPVPAISLVRHQPASPTAAHEVWVTAAVKASSPVQEVVLSSRVRGPFVRAPMFDDGMHHDGQPGDGVYGGRIPPQGAGQEVEYYLEASLVPSAGGAVVFSPRSVERSPYRYTVEPELRINEFVAWNESGIRDEKGEREDWIELLNSTTRPLDLGGLYLTDDLNRPAKWQIPAGPALPPDGTLLIWADEDGNQGPYHAAFKLDKDGEEIALVDRDGKTLLDRVRFGPQQADVSTGRLHGYAGVWASFPAPTPGARNRPEPGGHLAYQGTGSAPPFLELQAAGPPRPGAAVTFRLVNGPANAAGFLGLALAPLHLDRGTVGTLLIDPTLTLLFPVATGQGGTTELPMPIPNHPALVGASFYFQAFLARPPVAGFSNGVLTRVMM